MVVNFYNQNSYMSSRPGIFQFGILGGVSLSELFYMSVSGSSSTFFFFISLINNMKEIARN